MFTFAALQITRSCLLSLCTDETRREHLFICRTSLQISAVVNKFAAKFEIFVLSTLEKYQQFLHRGPWSAIYEPGELTCRKANKETLNRCKRPLFLLNIFQIFFIHVYEQGLSSLILPKIPYINSLVITFVFLTALNTRIFYYYFYVLLYNVYSLPTRL